MTTYYSALKFMQFADHLQDDEAGRIKPPVHVRVKPTNRCNHNCWYCAYRVDNLSLGEDMDEKDSIPSERMLALAHEFVESGVKAVTFSGGGEPLLYKALPEVIDILATGGIRVAALTNGSNLKGRMADAFAEHGTWIRVSLDAWDNPSYVKSRGAQTDGFSRLLDNIQAFTARDTRCVLGVSLIVGKDNHQHILEICSILKTVGVNHVKVSGAVVSNDVLGNNEYHSTIKTEVENQISIAQRALVDSSFNILNHYHDMPSRFEKKYSSCPSMRLLTIVGADQGIYTCQDKAYTDTGYLGSIANLSFKDFWNTDTTQSALRSFNPTTQCDHHCIGHNKNVIMHEYLSLDQDHSYFV